MSQAIRPPPFHFVAGKLRSAEEIHAMARHSALAVVGQHEPVTRQDVCRKSGLCELSAARALKELLEMGCIEWTPTGYVTA
jgi:hypothetical protein